MMVIIITTENMEKENHIFLMVNLTLMVFFPMEISEREKNMNQMVVTSLEILI